MRKLILSCLSVLFLCSQVFASTPANMRIPSLESPKLRPISDRSLAETLKAMPSGLTFYKDFTRIPPGTYSQSGLLDADYSIGSPVATFTSTNGTFTITANGYNATTANDEVLKYLIDNNLNRSPSAETIIIKFTPTGDFANDGVNRYLLSSDTKERNIKKYQTAVIANFRPNESDSSLVVAGTVTTPLDGVSYIIICVAQHTSPYAQTYLNGALQGSYTAGDYTTNAWGASFYIGTRFTAEGGFNGYIAKVMFFNRALSASEVSVVNNLL